MNLCARWLVILLMVCPAATLLAQQAPAASAPTAVQSATQQPEQPAVEYEIHGVLLSGATPLPGVTITAAHSLTGKKVLTSTDATGGFRLLLPSKGKWVVRAEFPAFAPQTQEIKLDPAAPSKVADFNLVLLSRAPKPEQTGEESAPTPTGVPTQRGRTSQQLSVTADENGLNGSGGEVPLPGMSPLANSAEADNPSLAVNGQGGQTRDFGLLNMDELRDRIEEMRARGELQGGGMMLGGGEGGFGGGPGVFIMGGPGGGGGRGGGFRNFNVNQPHGAIYYSGGNSALDAAPYSLLGVDNGKPAYDSNRFGGMVGGPLKIPHVYDDGGKTMFFLNFTGSRSTTPYTPSLANVPTADERSGNFCKTTYSSGPNRGQPVQLHDLAGNALPSCDISGLVQASPQYSIVQQLLNYIPQANQPGAQNYYYASSADNNVDNVSLRLIHNFGAPMLQMGRMGRGAGGRRPHNNINFAFNYSDGTSQQLTPVSSLSGTTHTNGLNASAGWSIGKGRLNNNLRANWNRNRSSTINQFAAAGTNVEGTAGITGVSPNAADYGLPDLSFSDYLSLNDIKPQLRSDQAVSLSDTVVYSHGKHNLRFGGDYRWIFTVTHVSPNPRGSFAFNGTFTGYDFADFLLGYAFQTAIQYSPSIDHFRANSYDGFVQDDWRVRGNLTINAGLRYEFIGPYTEDHNQIVNLYPSPASTACGTGFCQVVPVQPGQLGYPLSLLRPDRNNFAPRVGIAWKPKGDKTVIRAGYGINYNLGQYRSIITNLAEQPPFFVSQTNYSAASSPLAFGFTNAVSNLLTNTYGVDPNYRLGYVQMWNLNVQRELTPTLLLNVMYTGSKGTALDMMRAPNRTPSGLLDPNAAGYLWETSQGDSIMHAGSVRVRKRMSKGIGVGGTYIFSKSIDNASSIGGSGATVAQNDQDLAGERGPSNFDQRHKFTGDWMYEMPFGSGKRWLANKGLADKLLGDWTLSGDFTIASGTPFTAYILGDSASLRGGANGSLRADYNGAPIQLSNGTIKQWFNTAAFSAPAGFYGNAGRNTIIGPGTILFDLRVMKSFPMKDMMGLEMSAAITNVLNHPNYSALDTSFNSPGFGSVTGVASMRKISMAMRYRF